MSTDGLLDVRGWANLKVLQRQMLFYPSAFVVCWCPGTRPVSIGHCMQTHTELISDISLAYVVCSCVKEHLGVAGLGKHNSLLQSLIQSTSIKLN